ncbi:MAG: glutaminyl-tRNA synthase (glutamine-hydrolyzing) subunit A [Candidatus Zambryskibacteria bacterium RIFCSPHIGHO2_02_FULL_43_14]|uniref:Glutamyl-tRNA(Gln) amidotransferase subunit A n=1 Tax=Candidatus Zambryskibacteria bacterium RIFCSPHIGHO2_02_FULL_43_14 TaxID=1802748 RepID=A0A1G2TEY5_9BACT|nr:MAG: glutaminyl-tRNA synthase (glutamine-hydrolyzing) subunit A [Candidatus Zambryskibacteria bacterium RIFCSPHIGHO2_01_FULL_43_60]OHA95857.1 MAG: glutaminyl-tRNA synthase (glutamine-hydrolyzing) subunit A [Candidatus Zambryskibacteria bacterium RIFCSPHIGHO2_02_FULL_43_14]OHB03393.1 MAG: glutaminyl-tRNA synthase (glutamine-hydrolyzing) subunit A [Candidatus Zambryskibacteria bacterium RIFCSPLOWO2_01_FULL_42_41]
MIPDEIRVKDKDIHAFLEVFNNPKSYGNGLLSGKTVAIKDNILFDGHKVSAASKILENFFATYDATVVKKLKEAGAVIIGRTNMDEFAMGSSTENSAFDVTKNPYNLKHVAGGSSGGSAAAVAVGMADIALGSDTGGSIRQPAAFCGVVGLKPTYGRVSRYGLMAYGSSLDQIGPLAKTVTEAEILYKVIKGQDKMDSTTISDETYPVVKKFSKTIGVPRSFVESEGVSSEVKQNLIESVEKFKSLGYKIVDVNPPNLKYVLPTYYILALAEASSNLARFDGIKYGLHVEGKDGIDDYFKTRGASFGKEVRRRIILGTYVLSSGYYDEYYGQANEARRMITRELRELFREVDLMLTPTTPSPAWKIGEKSNNPLEMYLEDIFTVHANISGCPAISLPSGFSDKLPLGIELTADLGREDNLFVAGKEFFGE